MTIELTDLELLTALQNAERQVEETTPSFDKAKLYLREMAKDAIKKLSVEAKTRGLIK